MKRTVLAALCGAALIMGAAGHCYAESPSADKAMADHYMRAARAGDATAQFYLGALYSAGVGQSQSDAEAFRWFARAAEQGHAQATLILSGLYVIGRGAPIDNVSAYKWASIAESEARLDELRNGARQLMKVLESRLTPDELRQAKAEAGRWRPATSRDDSANAASGERRKPASLPAVSTQTRPSTVEEPNKPGRAAEAEADKKQKSDMDDLLNRLPSALRKRMGL